MTITTQLEVKGPMGGRYAFTDYATFDDGSTWSDIQGGVFARLRSSARFGESGFAPEDVAVRILRRG